MELRQIWAGIAALIVLASLATTATAAPGAEKVAVFEFELLDTSTQDRSRKPDADHARRLKTITDILRKAISGTDGYVVVDTAPVQAERDKMPSFTTCNGCALKLAAELDADVVVTGFVHKISLLIIDMAVAVRDAKTGKLVEHDSVSIRGDTDRSWTEGIQFLVRDRLFKGEAN